MLEIEGLALAHGSLQVVRALTAAFAAGQVTALVGPNGAGKTTLLRALAGEHRPVAGEIRLTGELQAATSRRVWRQGIAYMPQENRGRLELSAIETVLLGALDQLPLRVPEATLRRAAAALDQFGLAEVSARALDRLSGGQRQLVFFAQALMREPRVMLLDEPASALDLRHQHLLMAEVRRLCRERQLVTLVVLHDLNLAARFADRILMLPGDGRAVTGTPAEVLEPALLRRVYGVEARVGRDDDGNPWVRVVGAA